MTEPVVYPERWETDVVLSDGGTVHVRPIRPEDADAITALHSRLSDETVYFRFFSPMRTLPPSLMQRLVNVDYVDRMALVAELGDEIIAVARYDRTAGAPTAEVAFVVDDAHQGRGLGSLLLEHLVVIARNHGITGFVAETLPNNAAMLHVFVGAGFDVTRRFDGGVIDVAFPIDPTDEALAKSESREHRSVANSIRRLLEPSSVAVIGASRNPGEVGYELVRNLLAGGFAGVVLPVNPSAQHVAGVYAFASLDDVPIDIDLAVIAVPAGAVEEVVAACARRRVDSLVVVSSGFADAGAEGRALEQRVVATARRNGMRLVGPNCLGVMNTNPSVRLNATFSRALPRPGRMGFMSQSGALGLAVLAEADDRGVGISSFVAAGNKADVSGNDLLQYWDDDPATDVILLYLESFGNPRRFARIARRVARGKPIVAVQTGRLVAPGTDSKTTAGLIPPAPAAAVDGLFSQAGISRVDTLEQLFDVAQAFATQPLPAGRRVALIGNSVGPGSVAARAVEAVGLVVAELTESTRSRLRTAAPGSAAVANPIDLGPSVGPLVVEQVLDLVLADEGVDAAIVAYVPPLPVAEDEVAAAIGRTSAAHPTKPVLANLVNRVEAFEHAGGQVPVYRFPESAALALARMAERSEWLARPEGEVPQLEGFDADRLRTIADDLLADLPDGGWVDGGRALDLLAAAGIAAVPAVPVGTPPEAAAAAESIGFPVALKAAAADLGHRSDLGAVALGLESAAEVEAAGASMLEALGESAGGLVVQAMVAGGVEVVAGIVDDPSFGPLVMFGSGGRGAELLGDQVFRIIPVTTTDATEMVRGLRSSPLLFGYRGAPPVDALGLEDLLARLGQLADRVPEIAELLLDPVIAGEHEVAVVDVKVRVEPDLPRPERALRALDA